jgi:hypothetical protein
MKYAAVILSLLTALTMTVVAQNEPKKINGKVTPESIAESFPATIKGAPFSAEGISESVQTLADGNRITRSNSTRMFRDSEGRFRREGNSIISPDAGIAAFGFLDTTNIFDPVSGIRYSLNPSAKTFRRMKSETKIAQGEVIAYGQSSNSAAVKIETNGARSQTDALVPYLAAVKPAGENGGTTVKTESLGTREIEGLSAEGSRTVTTIPAGAIGNERPIEIVYERWYSKDLRLIVQSRRTDPRYGEQTYRLTNINRSEPDRSLFAPPADYKISAGSNSTAAKPL